MTQDGYKGWRQVWWSLDDDAGAWRPSERADWQTGACSPFCRWTEGQLVWGTLTGNKSSIKIYSHLALIFSHFCPLIQSNSDLSQSITDNLEWLNHLSERVDTLHMNTTVFVQVRNSFWWICVMHATDDSKRLHFFFKSALWLLSYLMFISSSPSSEHKKLC